MKEGVLVILLFVLAVNVMAEIKDNTGIDLSPENVEMGKVVFMNHCRPCHGLKYHKPDPIAPLMDSEQAMDVFGVVPPDLSLMARARGRGLEGAFYIYRLLTTYYRDGDGALRNRAFAEWGGGDGTTAMPPPIDADDPELHEKALSVASFLYTVADPVYHERRTLGIYVLSYMVVLTLLLFIVNKRTWKDISS